MVKKVSVSAVAVLMFFLFNNAARAEIIDRIVAIVNEDIITLVELNKAINPYIPEVEKTAYSDEQKAQMIKKLQENMLKKLIEFKLTEQEAERLSIKVTDKELQASIDKFTQKEGITTEELKEVLLKEKMTFEEYKSEMRSKMLRPKLINRVIRAKVVITSEEIEEYYKEHEEEYKGSTKYHLRNILVNSEAEIKYVHTLLEQGEDFKETAKLYSKAPNASSGGDLGAFELGVFADNIRESILLLKDGQYTDIILTDGGFQIFFLEGIEETKGRSVEDVKDEITTKLFRPKAEKKYGEWFEGLKERSHIKTIL